MDGSAVAERADREISGGESRFDTDAERGSRNGFRKRFARIASERETTLRAALAKIGVDTLELSTDDDLVDAIVRFADMRKRRVRTGPSNSKAVAA